AAAVPTAPAAPATDPVAQQTRVLAAVGTAADRRAADRPARERRRPAWLPWAGATFGLLLVVVLMSSVTHGSGVPAAGAATEEQSPATTSSSAAASERPTVRVRAADYVGLPAAEAKRRLEDRGLRVTERKVANREGRPAGTVADVDPTGRLREGTRVTLDVWGDPVVAQPKPPKKKAAAKPKHMPKHAGPGKHDHKPGPKGHKKKGH
ncbi:MAG: PASTA domain-containing protein, partial [Nocardioides sp.]